MPKTFFIASCIVALLASGRRVDGQATAGDPGIYAMVAGTVRAVSSTVIDKAAPSGIMSNAASLGFKGLDIKARIAGSMSGSRLTQGTPEFVFRGDSFKAAEYALVKLEVRDDRREFKTGKVGMLGRVKSELDKGAIIKTKTSKLDDGSERVAPEESLPTGEYAFVLRAVTPERVWSFGVD